MQKHSILLSLYLLFACLHAQSQMMISTPTTWDADTVALSETVTVEKDGALTIEAGTVVVFEAGTGLEVFGDILVNGTAANPVVFTGQDNGQWNGITLERSASGAVDIATFSYAEIYHASKDQGGAIYINRKEDVELLHCKLMFNHAQLGGAIYSRGSDRVFIRHTLIAENESTNGSVYFEGGNLTLSDVTIANNRSTSGVGGLFTESSLINIFNSILAKNDSTNIYFDRGDRTFPILPRYSLIEDGYLGATNLSGDPLFTDMEGQDYSLSANSPAVDAGCHCFIDADGTRSDMGYLSRVQDTPAPLPYTRIDSSSVLGGTWSNTTKPYAICSNITIPAGSTLSLGKGVELFFVLNREITVQGQLRTNATAEEPIRISSMDTTRFTFGDDDLWPVQLGWGGISFRNGQENELENVIFSQLGEGFIYYHELFEDLTNEHIGVYDNSSLTLKNCTFEENAIPYENGFDTPNGLLYVQTGSTMEVLESSFTGNTSPTPGSIAIYSSRADLTIRSSTFRNNNVFNIIQFLGSDSNAQPGANIVIDSCHFSQNTFDPQFPFALVEVHAPSGTSKATISSSVFEENMGGFEFSGPTDLINNYYRNNTHAKMELQFHELNLIGNLMYGNEDFQLEIESFQNLTMLNNTITDNSTTERYCIGIFGSANPQDVHNNIFYDNLPTNLWEGSLSSLNSGERSFRSNITNEVVDELNFSVNPRFQGADTSNYNLAANSPGINMGLEEGVVDLLAAVDIAGFPRIDERYGLLDIGALEFQKEISLLTDMELSDSVFYDILEIGVPVAEILTANDAPATFFFLEDEGLDHDSLLLSDRTLILNSTVVAGDTLTVRIRAEDDKDAWLEQDFQLYVVENTPPSFFALFSPRSASIPFEEFTFVWEEARDDEEVTYSLFIFSDETEVSFEGLEAVSQVVDVPALLEERETYQWRVLATDAIDTTYSETLSFFVEPLLSVPDADFLQVYPNPAHTHLQIKDLNGKNGKTAYIYSVNGTLMLSSSDRTIDISGLENGIYLMVLVDKDGKIAAKGKFQKE